MKEAITKKLNEKPYFNKEEGAIPLFCHAPWENALIDLEGTVRFCCYMRTDEALGNLNEKSFDEIWNGERAQNIREAIKNREMHPTCRCFSIAGKIGI